MGMLDKSFNNFENVYKTAYSHGLESIYAIENVDLRSIRRLQTPLKAESKSAKIPQKKNAPLNQLEFDFGISFQDWIKPFFLREPIHILGLSKYAEKALTDNGKKVLSDLIGIDLRSLIFLKGMGQGHLQEIQEKLHAAIAEKECERATTLDFAGWLRALFFNAPTKKLFVLLEKYQLQELVPVTAAESVEIKRLNEAQKREWIESVVAGVDKEVFHDDLMTLSEVFIKPWMNKRLGLVKETDLRERLQRISEDTEQSSQVVKLLEEYLTGGKFLLKNFIHCIVDGFYAAHPTQLDAFNQVQACASTYFYNAKVHYTLPHLILLIEREFAKVWVGFAPGFVEKVLKLSPQFKVYRTLSGEIFISKMAS